MQRFGSLASSLSVQKTAFGRCSRKPALVQSQVKFNRVPELCCSQVKFNRVPENVWEALVQTRSGSIAFRRRFRKRWEALMQSQVKFNRVPDKAPEKVPEK